MEINGRKIGLLFSVGAKYEISTLDKSMDNFMRTVKTAVIMSKYYETAKSMKEDYKPCVLTDMEVMTLSDEDFARLCDEVAAAFKVGNSTTVEAEEGKKKEDEAST